MSGHSQLFRDQVFAEGFVERAVESGLGFLQMMAVALTGHQARFCAEKA